MEALMLRATAIATDEHDTSGTDPVAVVAGVLEQPDFRLDYLEAKLAFDTIIDPSLDSAFARNEIDRLHRAALELAGADQRSWAKLRALRILLYEQGPWNEHRPFAYDQSDPDGKFIPNKLLHTYLKSRRGQCVSMPALFLILAEKLGLNVALVMAPEHLLVRFTDESGEGGNIETTSGGQPARDSWIREQFRIDDRAVESGIYLRPLSKRQGVAVLAGTIVERLFEEQRFEEVIPLAKLILKHHPLHAEMIVLRASACGAIADELRREFPPFAMPPVVRARGLSLCRQNAELFAHAEDLGWAPFE
jgi:regulator of sirC expression with transglutaminase-like and TPR domain